MARGHLLRSLLYLPHPPARSSSRLQPRQHPRRHRQPRSPATGTHADDETVRM